MLKRLTIFGALLVLMVGFGASTYAQDEPYNPTINPANFVEKVDNPYFPLTPGTTMVYIGESEDGTERIEVTVMPETRVVMGILCVVVRDTVWLEGELIEDTFDWFAQDTDGNVWYFGEETYEYEDGVAVNSDGAWEAGVDGALPGIVMLGTPEVGVPYRQEYYEGEAEDMGEVISLNESLEIPYGAFDGVLVTRDWNPLEPGVTEHKYFAPGVGLILEEKVEGGDERVELVEIITHSNPFDDGDEGEDDDEGENEDDDSAQAPSGTPIISESEALAAAESVLGGETPEEIELEYQNGRWVYSIETDNLEIEVDAITGAVLNDNND
jgi:hypothetical protein